MIGNGGCDLPVESLGSVTAVGLSPDIVLSFAAAAVQATLRSSLTSALRVSHLNSAWTVTVSWPHDSALLSGPIHLCRFVRHCVLQLPAGTRYHAARKPHSPRRSAHALFAAELCRHSWRVLRCDVCRGLYW
jgi:hypothetical protein